jgi:hypothetical protein
MPWPEVKRTDAELLDGLEKYIRDHDYLLIHNTNGTGDPKWPAGWCGGGLGFVPLQPRTLRQAIDGLLGVGR